MGRVQAKAHSVRGPEQVREPELAQVLEPEQATGRELGQTEPGSECTRWAMGPCLRRPRGQQTELVQARGLDEELEQVLRDRQMGRNPLNSCTHQQSRRSCCSTDWSRRGRPGLL